MNSDTYSMPRNKRWSFLRIRGSLSIILVILFILQSSSSLKLQNIANVQRSLGGLISAPTASSDPLPSSSSSSSSSTSSSSSSTASSSGKREHAPPPPSLISQLNLKWTSKQSKDYHKLENLTKVEKVEELECVQSMFMSPFHNPVEFSLNNTIYTRIDKKCNWNFFGTEPCIPIISCNTTQMGKCENEFLEIVDGDKGFLKVCSGDPVNNITASHDLRDLFLHYKVINPANTTVTPKDLLKCTVVCSKRGAGTPLQKKFTQKINPKCYCGTKPNDDRIVGGEEAKKFELPWLVALVETNTRQPFCGGSIINNRFIQTAGHCIKGKYVDYRNIQIVVNGHEFDSSANTNIINFLKAKKYPLPELEKLDRENGSARYNIQEIIVHPLYVSENNDFDIALLKLQTPLDLTPKPKTLTGPVLQQPRAICLPPIGSYLRTYSNKKAVIAGWGLVGIDSVGTPKILQKLEVNVFSPAKCKKLFAHRVNRRMICAGHEEGEKDSCSGDSGGPLVLEDRPKVWIQIGSVSWGEGCGEEGHPGVYFRTTEGLQWITYISNYYAGDDANKDEKGATWCIVPPSN